MNGVEMLFTDQTLTFQVGEYRVKVHFETGPSRLTVEVVEHKTP